MYFTMNSSSKHLETDLNKLKEWKKLEKMKKRPPPPLGSLDSHDEEIRSEELTSKKHVLRTPTTKKRVLRTPPRTEMLYLRLPTNSLTGVPGKAFPFVESLR